MATGVTPASARKRSTSANPWATCDSNLQKNLLFQNSSFGTFHENRDVHQQREREIVLSPSTVRPEHPTTGRQPSVDSRNANKTVESGFGPRAEMAAWMDSTLLFGITFWCTFFCVVFTGFDRVRGGELGFPIMGHLADGVMVHQSPLPHCPENVLFQFPSFPAHPGSNCKRKKNHRNNPFAFVGEGALRVSKRHLKNFLNQNGHGELLTSLPQMRKTRAGEKLKSLFEPQGRTQFSTETEVMSHLTCKISPVL